MQHQIKELLDFVNNFINKAPIHGTPEELYVPIRYTLDNGGKRIRPLMTLMGCELFKGNYEDSIYAATGLEIFHNFTLLHDDIMDNAPIRRGKPTVHEKWDDNTAILSGDAMLAIALEYMLQTPDNCLKAVLKLFNKTVLEVCEGQQYDMNFETMDKVSEDEYLEMIRLKTAVLPAACLKTGAMIAKAAEKDQELLYNYGLAIGMAFQLRDDYLDVFGDVSIFGKKTGGDILANKKTWLLIKAFELASSSQLQTLNHYLSGKDFDSEEKIREVSQVFKDLRLDELIHQKMQSYYDQAIESMDAIQLPDENKKIILNFGDTLLNRNS